MKRPIQHVWIEESMLETSLLFLFDGSLEEAREKIRETDVIDVMVDGDPKQGFCLQIDSENHKRGMEFCVIWWNGKKLETLSHEIIHLVFQVFDRVGIPTREENSEIFCRHSDWWFKIMREQVKIKRKAIK